MTEAEGVPETEGEWCVEDGEVVPSPPAETWRPGELAEVENLTYSNPFNQELERVWFDGKIVFAAELGELDLDLEAAKVAQEYQVVYAVELDERGKLKDGQEPERVDGQLNIYDSVPGMEKYSPLWQFNYVVVPQDYEPNALRSEQDCLSSGYEIRKSTVVEN
ncbi:MAG: hypothetical protein M3144_09175 [Actinomycetota bacterium]|nr:hypothetical protein [Actinomycetota bacterium]